MAAVWDDMPDETRAWWRARHIREQSTHSCGHPREVCSDGERDWYPQLTVCYVTMETEATQARYERLHEAAPWHDGSFKSWVKEPSASHPYHYRHGTRIWVAETDLGLGGDFLTTRRVGPVEGDSGDE